VVKTPTNSTRATSTPTASTGSSVSSPRASTDAYPWKAAERPERSGREKR
jgi:hypothetical protein